MLKKMYGGQVTTVTTDSRRWHPTAKTLRRRRTAILTSTAREFLHAQGITSALNFMASDANELAPAWAEWNEGALKTNKVIADIQCWKQNVRHKWSVSSTKEGAASLSHHDEGAELSQRPVAEAVAPTVEVIPFLESGARAFLLAQGITTAEAFLSTDAETIANALMHWRQRRGSKECWFSAARQCIGEWKKKLRKWQSSMSGQPIVELDAELKKLSLMARQFLSSQGIATAKAFLLTNSTTMANALIDWRKQWDSSECLFSAARKSIYEWKKRVRQLKSSIPGEPLVELDDDLKTLSSIARQFLSSQGIATAKAFLTTDSTATASALIA
jgi:hypothetical protein